MLLNGVSIKKMMEGYSKPRNRAIASAFAYMKIIEKWGSGIPRMIRECREYNLPEPQFIDFDGDFRVNMYRQASNVVEHIKKTTQTTQTSYGSKRNSFSNEDKAVLVLVRNQPTMTQKELAMELGWTVDRVKYYLNKMKKQQIIRRAGSSHNGHWEILVEENIF